MKECGSEVVFPRSEVVLPQAGEMVVIIEDQDPNWWKGSNHRGEVGLHCAVQFSVGQYSIMTYSAVQNSKVNGSSVQSTTGSVPLKLCYHGPGGWRGEGGEEEECRF